jgi:hypothetical protein
MAGRAAPASRAAVSRIGLIARSPPRARRRSGPSLAFQLSPPRSGPRPKPQKGRGDCRNVTLRLSAPSGKPRVPSASGLPAAPEDSSLRSAGTPPASPHPVGAPPPPPRRAGFSPPRPAPGPWDAWRAQARPTVPPQMRAIVRISSTPPPCCPAAVNASLTSLCHPAPREVDAATLWLRAPWTLRPPARVQGRGRGPWGDRPQHPERGKDTVSPPGKQSPCPRPRAAPATGRPIHAAWHPGGSCSLNGPDGDRPTR